jgi:uncharacterized protein YggE
MNDNPQWAECELCKKLKANLNCEGCAMVSKPLDAQVVYQKEVDEDLKGYYCYEKVGFRINDRVFWVGSVNSECGKESWKAYEESKRQCIIIVDALKKAEADAQTSTTSTNPQADPQEKPKRPPFTYSSSTA